MEFKNITKLTTIFRSLSDETRLKIVIALMDTKKNVNDIHETLGKDKISLSAISHQLRDLLNIGLIESERSGREKYYSLSNDFCWCILKNGMEHYKDNNCQCDCCDNMNTLK